MTATRFPVRSASWFQRAEWKISPWKPSMPLMSGRDGSHSAPTAETRTFATKFPFVVVTSQRVVDSFQWADCTSQPNRCLSRTLYLSATDWMYFWISGCVENDRVHSGFSANE